MMMRGRAEIHFASGAKNRLIPAHMNDLPANESDKISHARSLCDANRWAELLEFAQAWQTEAPTAAKSFFFRGIALTQTGRFVEAETAYRRALELDSTDFKAWNNLAALLCENLRRPGDALACLQKILEFDPQNKVAWSNLANLSGRFGRHEESLACAERALALDPQMVEAQLHRARAAEALGKKDILREASAALAALPPERFRFAR
jgi:tetratricopeptide (TPR) repeat protein